MKSRNINPKKYTGWDINQDLIDEANLGKNQDNEFLVVNLLNQEIDMQADIVIMLGLLNYNLKNDYDNFEYSKSMIRKAFANCKGTLIVDFLSINLINDYPKEDFVFYHSPGDMLSFAHTLTNNFSIFHNYDAIPQKEFMLVLEK
jgi:hypothetical protein